MSAEIERERVRLDDQSRTRWAAQAITSEIPTIEARTIMEWCLTVIALGPPYGLKNQSAATCLIVTASVILLLSQSTTSRATRISNRVKPIRFFFDWSRVKKVFFWTFGPMKIPAALW
jgi:hypothetical protein